MGRRIKATCPSALCTCLNTHCKRLNEHKVNLGDKNIMAVWSQQAEKSANKDLHVHAYMYKTGRLLIYGKCANDWARAFIQYSRSRKRARQTKQNVSLAPTVDVT